MNVLLALGRYRFAINTAAYQTLRQRNSYRWQSQARLGKRSCQQYVGEGEETLTLEGVIYPHFKGGLEQVKTLRNEAAQGRPLQLNDGNGNIYGHYVITAISEAQSTIGSMGQPHKVTFTIELKRYGEDVRDA